MRLIRLIAFLGIILLGTVLLAAPVLAQQSDQGGGGAAPGGGEQQPKLKDVEGKISDIDPAKKTMDVGGDWFGGTTLHITDQTRFIPGPGVQPGLGFSALKKGDRVRASYLKTDDHNTAQEVVILSPEAGETPPAAGGGAGGGGAGPSSSPQQQ